MNTEQVTYRNPWHKPGRPEYGPAVYLTHATPKHYRGYWIYERIPGHVWDVVKGGECITQRAGPRGARQAIDELCEAKNATQPNT
jgi:hypothetical protein